MFVPRSSATGKAAQPQPQSIEAVRRRARQRLIGASVLVLVGVIGFPLLFDTEPRPISVDIPIEIPAKNTAPSLAPSKPAAGDERSAKKPAEPAPAAPSLSTNESLSAREEVVESGPSAPEPAPKAQPKVEAEAGAPVAKIETPVAAKPAAKVAPGNDVNRAQALLEGKAPAKPTTDAAERLVVQVGAFAEASGAREVRQKLERAGLKTYTHVANTADGQRIRVRVGPFASRAEAEKVAARVKALGLPAAILTL